MHFIPAYMDKLSKGQYTYVKKRTQKYSKQTQYYAHTFNPKRSHGLPFFAKFPKISQYFEDVPRNHIWSQHRQGLYNGMFFVPAQPDVTKDNFRIPRVIFGNKNINDEFKESAEYKLIQQFIKVYKKMQIDPSMNVHLVNEEYDFTTDSEVKAAGMLLQSKYL